jgi:hypothetical protein
MSEKTLLTEAPVDVRQKIENAIRNRHRISILYVSDEVAGKSGNKGKSWRYIEPHTLGVLKSGALAVRAWETKGSSLTPDGDGKDPLKKIQGWRLFKLNNIRNVTEWDEDHPQKSFADIQRPKYNPYDKQMSSVYVSLNNAQPSNESFMKNLELIKENMAKIDKTFIIL